jgi:aspartate aminotransferase
VRPDGAFYLFLDVSLCVGASAPDGAILANDTAVVEYLLNSANVATVPGIAFAMQHYLRLSFALDEERVAEGCQRIVEALDKLELDEGPVR